MNWYFVLKALHVIGFVSWFAGLFYLVRLFVYHREAYDRSASDQAVLIPQYRLMEERLYFIIQTPAMVLTLGGGIGMLILQPEWLVMPWMHIKLGLIVILIAYHFSCWYLIDKLRKGRTSFSGLAYRLWNEFPTLLLIAIVMLAIWKNLSRLWLGLGFLVFLGLMFFLAAKAYKKYREAS